jgi:hypothetical protein
MSVLLSGRKIGYLQVERQRDGNTTTTTQTLALELNRTGKPLRLGNMNRSVEGADAEPISFAASTSMSAIDSTVAGRLGADGLYIVNTSVGGQDQETTLPWPKNALLAEGQRRAIVAAGRQGGKEYVLHEFNPASQRVVDVHMEIIGDERVALPDGARVLSHQRQRLELSHGTQFYDLWFDEQGIPRKGIMNMIGQRLEMVACSRECALAPNQDVDMFRAAMVGSPRPLTPNLRDAPMRYRVHILGGSPISPFIETGEQRVQPIGDGDWLVDVGSSRRGGNASPPRPEDSQPNSWLQSDAPQIREMAAKAVGNARNDRVKMRRLRSFVSEYITDHGLDVGYASALEVLKSRHGDCTEYAVLLAALARAQHIPARVVSGMVYVDRFAGTSRVFVPHEWMQAWVNDKWESYDAALRRFDSTHLALASGDGDPWRFFSVSQQFGNLRISEATPGSDLMLTAPPMEAPAPVAAVGGGGGGGGGGR